MTHPTVNLPVRSSTQARVLAVSGPIGAGKTTLATGLSSQFGWRYLAESPRACSYLVDLFRDPARWAFETQAAYLVFKATELQQAAHDSAACVVDCTVFETIHVYGRYYHEFGSISDRQYDLLRAIGDVAAESLPPIDLLVECACSPGTAEQRVRQRARPTDALFPAGFASRVTELCRIWLNTWRGSPVVRLDTERADTRDPVTLARIACEVSQIIDASSAPPREGGQHRPTYLQIRTPLS